MTLPDWCDTVQSVIQLVMMNAVQSAEPGPVANRRHATASRQLLQHFAVPELATGTKNCTKPQRLRGCNHHQELQLPSRLSCFSRKRPNFTAAHLTVLPSLLLSFLSALQQLLAQLLARGLHPQRASHYCRGARPV